MVQLGGDCLIDVFDNFFFHERWLSKNLVSTPSFIKCNFKSMKVLLSLFQVISEKEYYEREAVFF